MPVRLGVLDRRGQLVSFSCASVVNLFSVSWW